MNSKKVDRKVKQAFSRATPDVLNAVLAQWERQETNVIPLPEVRKKRRWPAMAAAAAALVVLCAGLGLYQSSRAVASMVSLDVNPGIEISVSRWDRVLAVVGCNEEGAAVIGGRDFRGSRLTDTVSVLVDTMMEQGYLTESSASVLIGVSDNDAGRSKELGTTLAQNVNDQLQAGNIEGNVVTQTVEKDDEVGRIMEAYGVTRGKAYYMKLIAAKYSKYSYEELSSHSIDSLWSLLRYGPPEQEVTRYIHVNEIAAKARVLGYAGVSAAAIQDYVCRVEYWLAGGARYTLTSSDIDGIYEFAFSGSEQSLKTGQLHYFVSFTVDGQPYQYELDDATGCVRAITE